MVMRAADETRFGAGGAQNLPAPLNRPNVLSEERQNVEDSGRIVMPRVSLILLTTLLACSGGLASAQVSDDLVKIGVLTDLSGPAATATGQGSVAAAQMAVEDFGGKVLGKPIQLISADHQIKPDIAAGIARQWYDRDQVDLIVDVPVSAVGLAVQNLSLIHI